jgi:hydrogenase maturation protease
MRTSMPHQNQDSVVGDLRTAALVVCVGNELVADDAVGYEVYTRLQAMELPSGARIEYAGVGGLALLDRLRGDERAMIVVDAVQFGAAAGTIHCLPWERVPSCEKSAISAHGIGLRETIDIGRILYPEMVPPAIVLVGIEGRCFNRMRDAMTPATAAAADDAAEYIRGELFTYLEEC